MHMPFLFRAFVFATGVAMFSFGPWALADPPSRVARLGYLSGAVSFSPAGESDWVQAMVNRPLTTGDRLWSDAGSRAEIQVGGAMIRMSAGTSVSILNLDDRIAQLQLTQGALNVRVRRLESDQAVEIATPNLAFTIRQAGAYRIEVDPAGTATTVVVRNGRGEVYGEGASYVIDSRQPYRFTGTDLREYRQVDAPRLDEFDRWSGDRDRGYDNSISARYVSQDVVGYQDLDANGTWRVDATYGNVWFPNRVGAGWAPYRDGHWAWIDPWGWTWVDDAPWGFAVSHYGRWTNLQGTWGWVPGPVRTRAYYAPALVVFVGGDNFQFSLSSGGGGIGWFPLGPREVYRPSYAVSRGYFENVNRSNTVINTTVINNYYNNTNVSNVVYANQRVPGAVVAVPTTVFAQSQPVSAAAVRVRQEAIASAPVAVMPSIAPTERSVRGGAPSASGTPPSRALERPVVARTAPPAAVPGFAAQQRQLEAKPGKPLDDATRRQLQPVAAAAPAPVVKVVEPIQKAPAAMLPPPAQSATRPGEGRGKPEPGTMGQQAGQPVASPPAPGRKAEPRTAPLPVATPQSAPQPPTAQPAEQRGRPEQRGNAEQRVPPAAPSPPPQRAVEPGVVAPPAVAPQSAPRPPTAQPAEQRGRGEQRGNAEQRVPPVAPAPPPQRAVAPEVVAPPAVAPQSGPRPPSAQRDEQRGRAEQRGNAEQRVPPAVPTPPPQRAAEPKSVAPQPAASAPVKATPPQQAAPPKAASPGRSAPSAPVEQQPAQKAKPQPAPDAEPPKPPKPAADKSNEKGKDGDDPTRDEDGRKPKR